MTATALLGDLVKVVGGGTPTRNNPEFFGGDIPWVTPKDMKCWIINGSLVNLTVAGLNKSPARLVPSDSVLVVVRSGVLKHTIPVALNSVPVALNQDMKALICSSAVLPAFLARFIKWSSPEILQWVRATTADNFPIDKLKHLEIPVPPLLEQRRITAILDQGDALRANRREALIHLDELTQSIFLDMFGDPVTNPLGWPITTLTQLGQLDRGVSRHRPRNDPSLLGGLHPLVQTGEVANSGGYIRSYTSTYSNLGLAQSKMWPTGTLCITIAANIAKTGILTFDACFPDSVVGFTSDKASTQYVRVWLGFLQATLERAAPQSAQKNINLEILRNLPVPMPPAESIEQFAWRVERLEVAKSLAMTHADGLDGLFVSLQSRAFAGEL